MPLIISQISEEEELTEIYKLRYKVYCQEWGFETPGNHANRTISDNYDEKSLHFAAREGSRRMVGAIMLIPHSDEGYPLEKYCELEIDVDKLPRDKLAEISKLVVHRDYRRRAEDKYIYGPDEERRSIGSFNFPHRISSHKTHHRRAEDKYRYKYGARRMSEGYSDRRRRHEVVLGLYKAIYQESKRMGLSHWYSIMTKGVVTLLNKFGFSFDEIGDPVDYHGIRTPYLAEISEMEEEMSKINPELYEEFTKNI